MKRDVFGVGFLRRLKRRDKRPRTIKW